MTKEQAEGLVDNLIDATRSYENAGSFYVKSARLEFHEAREALIAALTSPSQIRSAGEKR